MGGGGGAMLTPVAGSVFGGTPDPPTIPRTTTNLHSHQPFSSHLNLPLSANSKNQSSSNKCSCMDSFDGIEDKIARGSYFDRIFGPVPSRIEVEKAMSDLQRFTRLSTSKSEFNWLQQMLCRHDPRMTQSFGCGRIHDAFCMLQTDLSVQRMVISISSDKAVWDAILSNRAVQDLRGSLSTEKEETPQSSNEESDLVNLILKWILDITLPKVAEVIKKFGLLVSEIFQPAEKEKPTSELTDLFEEKVRSSLFLSVVILLIVVITRSHGV